ncbi:S-methyl-5'-thioadenosine phosphorylase [Candidatus Riflebacteria bacterium]
MQKKIGVIGGSGLYELDGLENVVKKSVETPWGQPSDSMICGNLGEVEISFIPRHGRGHHILPSEVNSRANICALKMNGVRHIVAFSAVGSLKEEIKPRDFVIPDQIIDRTRSRPNSFFGNGVVAHLPFADPFCSELSKAIIKSLEKLGISYHKNETLICMEGPLFSTRSESHWYRSMGAGLINMSALPEAKLAREAGISYCMVCMSTDYDCWKEDEEDVSLEMLLENLRANGANAKKCLLQIINSIDYESETEAMSSVKTSIITAPEARNPETVEKLKVLLPDIFS